jgi:hypothetical protein
VTKDFDLSKRFYSDLGFTDARAQSRRVRQFLEALDLTRTEGINLRGVLSLPIEQYAEQLLAAPAAMQYSLDLDYGDLLVVIAIMLQSTHSGQ